MPNTVVCAHGSTPHEKFLRDKPTRFMYDTPPPYTVVVRWLPMTAWVWLLGAILAAQNIGVLTPHQHGSEGASRCVVCSVRPSERRRRVVASPKIRAFQASDRGVASLAQKESRLRHESVAAPAYTFGSPPKSVVSQWRQIPSGPVRDAGSPPTESSAPRAPPHA